MRTLIAAAIVAASLALAQEPPIYTPLRTDVSPQVVAGRTFIPARAVTETLGGTATWVPATQTVILTNPGRPTLTFTIGSTAATVGNQTATLDAAPFITQGRAMVPLRFIAESWNVPIEYREATRSVWITQGDRIYILPLEDTRTGITIDYPRPNELVRNPIIVQGQANVFEGNLIVEVRDRLNNVIGRTITTAGMGGFYPYRVTVFYNMPSDEPVPGRIVVYSPNPRGENLPPLATQSVQVRLASTV